MRQVLICLLLLTGMVSCQKEKCENCILFEVSRQSGDTIRTDMGKKCGDELEKTRNMDFMGSDGETYVECGPS